MVKNQILLYFGKTWLDKITSEDINNWLLGFKERKALNVDGKEEVKSYKNTYANTVFGTFWLMLNEAVNRGIIRTNPAAAVKKLKNDRKARRKSGCCSPGSGKRYGETTGFPIWGTSWRPVRV
jgi:hypothetical protein